MLLSGLALLFLLAPIGFMLAFSGMPGTAVDRMSQIGQAYGGLSALLSGGATFGVVIALVMQTRQIRMSQAQGIRMMQIELMKILIEHPDVRPRPPLFDPDMRAQHRRDIFTNLMYRYLEHGYEIGYLPDEAIRLEMINQFSVPDIRRWWELVRGTVSKAAHNEHQQRFFAIAESAFESAVAETAEPEVARPRRRTTRMWIGAGGVTALILAGACAVRRRRRR
ncbi:hypothetical protein J2S43_006060 [Catenuloplanes nepalensis]|uniref:DUF4129 domain-containing protein n=1 Tax=Catenuloplanes nepalensis TaxID=587533 RepID=A0ABT9N1H6_9ACTN|nr:DUF6082 family protein [Catenuloplanes nepalensis]MDP9797548.1 hypothetical protein [Catenuloplanes nepalensis]